MVQKANCSPPKFMELGSKGPHVNIWLRFLESFVEYTLKISDYHHMIEVDEDFGPTGVYWTRRIQLHLGIDTDGGVGTETRQRVTDKFNFNFDMNMTDNTDHGLTKFIQPDGSELWWQPGIPPCEQKSVAEMQVSALRVESCSDVVNQLPPCPAAGLIASEK